MNAIYFSLDKHILIQLLRLELSSTFDSISHDILINRLSLIIITGNALQILILLIKEITYSVKIHTCISGEHILLYGVLQESTPGPLFTLFIFLL